MKYYSIKTLMVSLPEQSVTESIVVTLPNNAMPIGIEVRPLSMPEGLFLHYLIPCDENGNPIEEVITPNLYEIAWNELYKLYGERLEQDNLEVMDAVLVGAEAEIQDGVTQQEDK